ncbi:hypothetical protein MIMGU_mgv1a004314mg [Erythranthe guttata]|uniref:Cytochrome P450 n=1 Tax=Erythranthe guttata TaxID=4155 RepID=A0A022RBN6_ERYGU|nr:PREDICTED: ferruginol synthase-like [Erythranthe guttata]EYU36335.1 hypothetical protein MIMGU_mgv1a004314mg [Erythranthe guttata]|eukprot:XP_012838752.1 PREDICTED: ferruginol synthase-like [Erythranthe guttata]
MNKCCIFVCVQLVYIEFECSACVCVCERDEMGFITLLIILFTVLWAAVLVFRSNSRRRPSSAKLPPGPYRFPIVGNIPQLGLNPHQSFANLSKTYGPLMSLHLGSVYTVVVSSPEIAREVLQKHDQVFSGRIIGAAAQVHDHHNISIAYLPAGIEWRKKRKICREHMFSTHRLDESQALRREKLQKLCDYVSNCCGGGGGGGGDGRAVNIGEAAFITSLNLMSATLFSVDFTDFDSDATQDLKETIEGVAKILGTPNLADFFPIFKRFDPQGIQKKAEFYFGKLLGLFEDIINQRLESRRTVGSSRKNDLLETLFDLSQGTDYDLTCKDIKHLLVDLFVAGTDTTSSTVEWAMTELLLNPEKMANAKNELTTLIGKNKQVQESDISKLPYLRALVKETFRYHPGGPLLIPHKAEDDVEINGYTIPKDTQILVNVWAIGRDSSIWSNPDSFEPERFLDSKVDFKGQDFELIPFGSGRRMCPGLPLVDRMLHLTVASLIHNFDWKLEAGVKLDTEEKFGLSLHKAVPLEAIPTKV